MYNKERLIIGIIWLLCISSLWFIPKGKYREASVIFLITQIFAWILGLIVVEAGWIEYPVREFYKANATSFSFEYFILPLICIFFNLYYPNIKKPYLSLLYYVGILAPFTFLEHLVEKYTKILTYIHWEWYYTFISMWVVIYLVRVCYKLFFKIEKPLSL